ncbi:MAG: chlorite dismutase family protein [Thermomicrobium sp.]|nr:chlorite dismutase family protein [Thermomicrobium sp.]MDW7982512.1 chlorite dismutase family protein [Thermomicrobium sp.]
MNGEPRFTVFWLAAVDGRHAPCEPEAAIAECSDLLDQNEGTILRGAYLSVGFRPDVDLILWLIGRDPAHFQDMALALRRTAVGRALDIRYTYLGMAGASQYDPAHGPAFLRGEPPKRYLSVYPFVKTPEWYLLPFEERRRLMAEHGRLGDAFPSVLTNTVNSFGVQDQEFVVALEDDDVGTLITMVQRLRAAEVRKYTQVDTPIFLGRRYELAEALRRLFS